MFQLGQDFVQNIHMRVKIERNLLEIVCNLWSVSCARDSGGRGRLWSSRTYLLTCYKISAMHAAARMMM